MCGVRHAKFTSQSIQDCKIVARNAWANVNSRTRLSAAAIATRVVVRARVKQLQARSSSSSSSRNSEGQVWGGACFGCLYCMFVPAEAPRFAAGDRRPAQRDGGEGRGRWNFLRTSHSVATSFRGTAGYVLAFDSVPKSQITSMGSAGPSQIRGKSVRPQQFAENFARDNRAQIGPSKDRCFQLKIHFSTLSLVKTCSRKRPHTHTILDSTF
jgi:hypothetical protein